MFRLNFHAGLSATLALAGLLIGPAVVTAQKAATADQDDDLVSFLPRPDSVFLQQTSAFPGIGNVRVLVQLSGAEMERLATETGHSNFIVLGPDGNQTILRDDGVAPDDVAGDRLFTGVGNVDQEDLEERASTDSSKTTENGGEVPVFAGRALTGTEEARAFNLQGFTSGQTVELTEPVESLSTEKAVSSASNEDGSASVRLLASDGDEVLAQEEIRSRAASMVTLGINAFQNQVLMITDPTVVADASRTFDVCTGNGNPNGVWTFNHLMTEMANPAASGINPSTFVERWLDHWLTAQTINTDNVPARTQMQSLIDDWRAASGGGDLDLSIAPFRLLAIVSRLDLATTRGGGSGYAARSGDFLDAGEARFVFGVVLPPGYDGTGFFNATPLGGGCRALPFSVIFEYRVPRCDCKEVRSWARQWVRLASLPFPSGTYNAALERITRQFTSANSNPLKPNGSALGQLRTNEIALTPPGQFLWELREFQLPQFRFSFLTETTVADNPIASFNNTPTFSNWVLGPVLTEIAANGIGAPIPPVPLFFQTLAFLGGHAPVPVGFWTGPGINFADMNENWSRHRASLATCESCHRTETLTPFVHVDPNTAGLPANLSGFLTGIIGVPDPANPAGTPARDFDDLARRELDIKKKARMLCFRFHRVDIDRVLASLQETRRLPTDLFAGLTPEPLVEQISVAEDALLGDPVSEVH